MQLTWKDFDELCKESQPNDETLNVGDVVYLRSGGPAMTVLAITDLGLIVAGWFDDQRHISIIHVLGALLRKA